MTFEEQLEFANQHNLFMVHNKIKATVLNEEKAEVMWEKEASGLNAMGGVHGGLLFLMGDCAAGLLARAKGGTFVTLDSTFRYLRDGREAKSLLASSTLVKRGTTVTIVRSVLTVKETGKVLAEGEFTFFCVDKK